MTVMTDEQESGRMDREGEQGMFGAIVGDIVGSVYEWSNIRTKEFPLFRADCHFTDDTVIKLVLSQKCG